MQVHRCRFTDYVPQAINAIEYAPATGRRPYVAVGRANGDIELWCVKEKLVYEKTIPGVVNGSLESLAWAHQTELTADDLELFDTEKEREQAKRRLMDRAPRLFSAGLNAVIVEWDLARLVPKAAVDSYGGAVWCMATNHAQTQLAIGTEDGHIRIFDITDDKLAYQRCFDKSKTRILSVAWSHDDESIMTGSADGCVRIWSVGTGRMTARMTLPREGRDPTLVWAITVLKSGTIVSGDSRGHVVFWDHIMHVVQQDFRALGADVLCLVADADGHTVFASGVDPKVTQFKLFVGGKPAGGPGNDSRKKAGGRAKKWQLAGIRRYHTHDVRALAVSSHLKRDLLISGGVDTQVTSCESRPFPNENPYRQPCFPPLNGVVSVAMTGKLILQRQANVLKLWELGKAEPISHALGGQMESGQGLQIYERQRDLLRMELKTKTNLLSSTISSSGRLIAASDAEGPKLFSVTRAEDGSDGVHVRRIRGFPPENFVPEYSENRGALHMQFTSDETRVVVATADAFVSIIDISGWQQNEFATIRRHCQHRNTRGEVEADAGCSDVPTHPGDAKNILPAVADMRTITSMAVSDSGAFVATSDSAGYVVVAGLENKGATVLPPLAPRKQQDEWPTALAFATGDQLVLPTNMNHLFVWDAPRRMFTKWSRAFGSSNIPKTYSRMLSCVSGVAVNPAEPNCIYVYATNHITRIDLTLAPGSHSAVLNIHKRKQIEQDIIAKVVEEKERETSERLSEWSQSKRKKQQHRNTSADNSARMDIDGDAASAADSEDMDSTISESVSVRSQGKDWEGTIVARLREAGINVAEPHNFRMTERYQNLMHASFIDANTMVVLERPWTDVSSALPAAFHRHKYGS
ncbi:U3 small nucleolar RNA-associated protein [Coemansia sp. RSA 989]|nr:U3 small nucleolar RNA-associated protein [Coemansia sp. RSA 1821]KAJ1866669.1 U3 small nucleolar RNA-associated protein [Coemansia sp. RSA 989]KAJ1875508.1 U3 small nucleolar RNA-associated protein [Coemansia sp. RSA 990]KAJ2674972.1 U3 small nucleolar RNA-associated protein [Coemansia sp. RSA 1085]